MKQKIFTAALLIFLSMFSNANHPQTGFGISDKGTLNSYPYILKRLVNDSFDYFQMGKNNWQYTNGEGIIWTQPPDYTYAVMWPQAWWQQFDYSQPQYPLAWRIKAASSFPDWPLFVETFGESYCYLNPPPALIIYNPLAATFWLINSRKWGGSCYGLAAGSVLAFSSESQLKQRFSTLGSFEQLYSVTMNDNVRKVINLLFTMQWNKLARKHLDQNINNSPNHTLSQLKSLLSYANNIDNILILDNQNGSTRHAVIPYLIREGTDIDTVEIYDNNHITSKRILINKINNTWDYKINNKQWGGNKGLFLTESLTSYLNFIPHPKNANIENDTIVSLYSETDDAILITNINEPNEYILYNPADTSIVNTFSFGIPIIPITGIETPPIGYRLLDGSYKIKSSSKLDSSINITAMRDNSLINYRRVNSDSSETDFITVKGDSLIVQNFDPVDKTIDIQYISEENEEYRTYVISNLVLVQNDSITSELNSLHDFIISNPGDNKSYDLRVLFQSAEKEEIFLAQQVELNLNSGHHVSPMWDSLSSSNVMILVDIGNNGIFDDTLFVVNQLFSFQINDAWNLISLPVIPADSAVSILFPFAQTKAFSYQPSTYIQNDFMSPGAGYWLKFNINHNVEVIGEPVISDTIVVSQGWNLIGSIRNPLSITNIMSIPPNIISSPFYKYEGSYIQSSELQPGKGYWVNCSEAGVFILSSDFSALNKSSQSGIEFLSEFASLRISDITGAGQSLYITQEVIENINFFELPPLPPAGVFDARFSSNRMLETINNEEQVEIPIIISSAEYPVTISWDMTKENFKAVLRNGNEGYLLTETGSITLSDAKGKIFLLIGGEPSSLPMQFSLEQNYPNPFNNNTVIKFSISNEELVNISVYNILGEKVAEVTNEVMKPGRYEVEFNSLKLASGIYLYKLQSGNYVEVKKMMLLK